VVERGPEKAGVGGSIPSLATIFKSEKIRQHPKARVNAGFRFVLSSNAKF